MFAFGSKIGQITNKGTVAYSLLPIIEEQYGKDSEEYKLTISRLQQGCVAQSKQIDKTKIGRNVKSIPKCWIEKNQIDESDDEQTIAYKELMNHCLLNKHPYFFRYKYADTDKAYKEYHTQHDNICKMEWGISLDELLSKKEKTEEQRELLRKYYEYIPVIDSDSPMNVLCKLLEKEFSETNKRIKSSNNFDYSVYKFKDVTCCKNVKYGIIKDFKEYSKYISSYFSVKRFVSEAENDEDICLVDFCEFTNNKYNIKDVVNVLVDYCYADNSKKGKELLWFDFGKYMCDNLKKDTIKYPMCSEDEDYDIEYLGEKYKLKEVKLDVHI